MREMKDSGVEWIGEIPREWDISRIKQLFLEINERCSDSEKYTLLSVSEYYGVAPRAEKINEDELLTHAATLDGYKTCSPGDIAINIMLAWKRALGVSRYVGIISPAYCVYRARANLNPWYYHYLFRTDVYADLFKQHSTGIIDSRLRLYTNKFFALRCQVPPVLEQNRIVTYLDVKCAQIDAIIARQQEIIEKLKAYKLSVITEAVTKGLNPDVPTKDSGVAWIGKIPAHWSFSRMKNCCMIVDCKNRTPDVEPDGEYTVVRTTCIKSGRFTSDGSYRTNQDNFEKWTARGNPAKGDVFFTREAPMGEACLVPDEINLCMGQRVMFFRPQNGADPRFILYSIYGPLVREYIDSRSNGSTVGHLKLGQVFDLPLLYCHPSEQAEIANYLDDKCHAVEATIAKKQTSVTKLTEYKKSLIYEVVTGKKEV